MERFLTKKELFGELGKRAGLIPVDLDPDNRIVKWLDAEAYHFYEGFFHKSLRTFSLLKGKTGAPIFGFKTDLDVFADDKLTADSVYPTGFIFHAGRSGSTLLAKILARSRKHLVLSEVALHNNFWLAATGGGRTEIDAGEKSRRLYRNLLLATARRRIRSHAFCFVKFTSYNIFFYDFIRRVFPDVPAIFLYREPAKILASINKTPLDWIQIPDARIRKLLTGVSGSDVSDFDSEQYKIAVLSNLFKAAAKETKASASRTRRLTPVNFNQLTPDNLASILEFINAESSASELAAMKSQFKYYSKSENRLDKFSVTETQDKSVGTADFHQPILPAELLGFYRILES